MGKTTKSKSDYSLDESVSHFLNLKLTKKILQDKIITPYHHSELHKFFAITNYSQCYDQIMMNVAYFILYDLDDFYTRISKLRSVAKNSEEWHVIQMGEAGKEIFTKKYITNINLQRKSPSTRSSKAALAFFKSVDSLLLAHNITVQAKYDDKESNNHEFRIRDENMRWHCYDYTIKELNIIIEYHGEHCHPKKEQLGTDWRNLFTNETAEEAYVRDLRKQQLAESKGYEYHVIWHGEDANAKNQKIIDIFNNFNLTVPTVYPKRYRRFMLTTPEGTEILITKLKDVEEYGISEHYLLKLKEGIIESHNGFKLRKVS